MKTIILFLVILFVLLFESPGDSFGQWQPDVRLTNDLHESITSQNNAKVYIIKQ